MAFEKNATVPYTPARARICLEPIPSDLYRIAGFISMATLCVLCLAHFGSTAHVSCAFQGTPL